MQKIIKTWMIVNVKNGECRCIKKLKQLRNASEVAVEIKLNVTVPEQPVLKAEGSIVLGASQVANMMIENITDQTQEEDKQ